MQEARTHDFTGLKCPMPIVKLNRIMKELAPGQTCMVTADDIAFCPDILAWCAKTGNVLVSCETETNTTVAIIRKQS